MFTGCMMHTASTVYCTRLTDFIGICVIIDTVLDVSSSVTLCHYKCCCTTGAACITIFTTQNVKWQKLICHFSKPCGS